MRTRCWRPPTHTAPRVKCACIRCGRPAQLPSPCASGIRCGRPGPPPSPWMAGVALPHPRLCRASSIHCTACRVTGQGGLSSWHPVWRTAQGHRLHDITAASVSLATMCPSRAVWPVDQWMARGKQVRHAEPGRISSPAGPWSQSFEGWGAEQPRPEQPSPDGGMHVNGPITTAIAWHRPAGGTSSLEGQWRCRRARCEG